MRGRVKQKYRERDPMKRKRERKRERGREFKRTRESKERKSEMKSHKVEDIGNKATEKRNTQRPNNTDRKRKKKKVRE